MNQTADILEGKWQRDREIREIRREMERMDMEGRDVAPEEVQREKVHALSNGEQVLIYESYLEHQAYYDDLKHVDYKYIDYGSRESKLVIEQDKTLGKGGFCWDAAFVLGSTIKDVGSKSVIELGSGTGLAGLLLARENPDCTVLLTDLPELLALLERNVARNSQCEFGDIVSKEYCSSLGPSIDASVVKTSVLAWGDTDAIRERGTFDYVVGADVVATLYDPISLAQTIHDLSHEGTTVHITFKERLSSVHRIFEGAMKERFESFCIEGNQSRNKSPHIRILNASQKKQSPFQIKSGQKTGKGKVEIQQFGQVSAEDRVLPDSWPDGKFIQTMLQECIQIQEEPWHWQSLVRYALLRKFDLIQDLHGGSLADKWLTIETSTQISRVWKSCVSEGDLAEFMLTSHSNKRPLQWSLMSCGPACQFKLHSHPNLEIAFCVSGALHEIRMSGDPLPVGSDATPPSLSSLERPWSFHTLHEGEWLVNEVGSIHKSFTAANQGCILLVLWGGSHANIEDSPRSVDVQKAVDTVSEQLMCCGSSGDIQQTFLPQNERLDSL